MKDRLDALLERVLARWIELVRARAVSISVWTLLATGALLVYTLLNLGVNLDNVELIAEDLPSRRNHEAFAALFPNLENALLVVVDAGTPELAREATNELVERLEEQRDRYEDVYLASGGDFFERNSLLYRSVEDLDEFGDQMASIQPLIAQLERDPSIDTLVELVQTGLEAAQRDATDVVEWEAILDRVGDATVSVYSEYPLAVSWEEVLLQGSAIESTTRRVLVVHPVLEFGSLLPAADAIRGIRETAEGLGYTPERGVRVRITGNPALNHEELIGLAWAIGGAGLFCFLFVVVVLYRALRSTRLVAAAVATLLVGLVWSAAFATAAIGHLTIISLCFAILFIGLGVDFAIHLGMRYADLLRTGRRHEEAIRSASGLVGSSLVLCTLTTSIGFYVFVPTDYLGVAELGLISGTGMIVILFLTLTFLPALLERWLRLDPERPLRGEVVFRHHWWSVLARHPRAVCAIALATGAASLTLLPQLRFDPNVVRIRDQGTESVQVFNELLEESGLASPWYVDAVAPDLARARALAEELAKLDVVAETVTLADYVPENQQEKLALLEDIAFLVDSPPPPALVSYERSAAAQQVRALRELRDFLDAEWLNGAPSTLARSMRLLRQRIDTFLARVEEQGRLEDALASFETILLSSFPDQIARLRTALSPSEIALEDLPEELASRMLARSGEARVQVFPSESLVDEESFARFVDEVREVAPRATGEAMNLMAFSRATRDSFREALTSAVIAIAALLLLLWQRLSDTLLVLAPLTLSAVTTCAAMVLLDIPFNFVNVIVIPLLFGIGVDSGIHLVHRVREAETGAHLLETTTARAVFFSALTTTVSFGSLGFSSHLGMRSLGILLAIGMALTITSNLVVLPALLALRGDRAELARAGTR